MDLENMLSHESKGAELTRLKRCLRSGLSADRKKRLWYLRLQISFV